MKKLEEVKKYLKEKGMNDKDIHKVIGFLYAEGDFVLGTPLNYKRTENCFANFVKWYENENDNDCFKQINEYGDNILAGWMKLKDIVVPRCNKISTINIDLQEIVGAIEDIKPCIDKISENVVKLQAVLESWDENEE